MPPATCSYSSSPPPLHTQTDIYTDTHRHTPHTPQTQIDTDTQIHTDRHIHRYTQTHTTHTTDTHRHGYTDTQTQLHRHTYTYTDTHSHTQHIDTEYSIVIPEYYGGTEWYHGHSFETKSCCGLSAAKN